MIYFQCDYAEGAHPRVMQRLTETNLCQTVGYGEDEYCDEARSLIRTACGTPDADVHLLVGGTQTNATVIASVLRPHQGAVAADTGHIAVHETGAIEASGHKVLTLPSHDGKLNACDVEALLSGHFNNPIREHEVQPGLVYISFPTETGTIYTKQELSELKAACDRYGIPLFIDGARLGYGLADPRCDLTLPELAALCDVFYIGGTKCGLLFGEAVVFTDPALGADFRYHMKQRGGLLAKGRLLGVQFGTLFRDGLYFTICKQAVAHALRIRAAFEAKGIAMFGGSMTNQQFPILSDAQIATLQKKYVFEEWGPAEDGGTIVRFCTSWATTDDSVEQLVQDIASLPV